MNLTTSLISSPKNNPPELNKSLTPVKLFLTVLHIDFSIPLKINPQVLNRKKLGEKYKTSAKLTCKYGFFVCFFIFSNTGFGSFVLRIEVGSGQRILRRGFSEGDLILEDNIGGKPDRKNTVESFDELVDPKVVRTLVPLGKITI